jgi:DUF4097 and DUF4098 domain-containing protein YvlB
MNNGKSGMRRNIGMAGLVLACLVVSAGTAGAQRASVDTSIAIGDNGTLSVSIYSGRVNVTAGSDSRVTIKGNAASEDLSIRSRSNGVRVQLDHGSHNSRVELDITVPTGTRVVMDGFAANFTVRGVQGETSLETLSGHITVAGAIGKVNLESVSGHIEATDIKGDVTAESVNGRVTVSNIEGDVTAESVSSALVISGASARSVRAETVSGSLSYDGTIEPAGNYSFTTHSGPLTLAVPANAGATVSLETFNGSVDSDFPVTLESGVNRREGESQFEFRIGNGRARIALETFSGNIRIERGSSRANRE